MSTLPSGGTPSRNNPEYFNNGSILWVKSGELKEQTILDTDEKITSEGLKDSSAKLVPAGTVLLALYGANVGRIGLLGVDASTNQAIATIQCNQKFLINKYLFYFLITSKAKLLDRAAGGAQQNISQGILADLLIPLPPLNEQKRIAAILDKADRLRRLRHQACQLTDSFLQSVFIEMFGDPSINQHNYPISPLGDSLDGFEGGINFNPTDEGSSTSEWRVLKISSVTWGTFNPEASKPISKDSIFNETMIVRKGDLLMSRANTTELVGAVSMVRHAPPKVLLPDKIWRLKFSESSKLEANYTLFVLRHPSIRRLVGELATGTSGSMQNISKEKAATIPVPIPATPLQERFSEIVEKCECIKNQQHEVERQAELNFQALLNRAFTGQLVREAALV